MKSTTIEQAINEIRKELKSGADKVSIQFQLCDMEELTKNERILKEVRDAYNVTESCDGDKLDSESIYTVEFCIDEIERLLKY